MIHTTLKTNDDLEIVDIQTDDQPQVNISKVVEDAAVVELFYSALHLRNQILALRSSIPPTPTSEDLLEDGATVPPVLYNFLAWLFCGAAATADGDITLEAKVSVRRDESHRHIMSLAQDLVLITSQGRVRTPKHFMLLLTVQHLTGHHS